MDGLSKIITKIQEENAEECKRTLDEADKTAEKIISEAKTEAQEIKRQAAEKSEKEAALVMEKAASGAELEYRRIILAAKCEIIEAVTQAAMDYFAGLDDEKYFSYIERLAADGALAGDGKIMFSERDFKRVPKDFEKSLNQKLGKGKSLSVSDEFASCRGGFLIIYPEMRVDCTFESLLDDAKEDIRDTLGRILFA